MGLAEYIAVAIAGGLGMMFGIGGLLEWRYYRHRDRASEWKTQPARWPTPAARRREILLGAANTVGASVVSGWFAHHVASGGATAIYWDARHGVLFSIATTLLYFVATDGLLYGAHRLLHRRFFFRHIHRVHHRWTSPTAFTAPAMHPLEFALYQGIMLAPLFFLPIHVVGLVAVLVYQNTIAFLDHSGVALGSVLPWQPPPRFHDDHHVHFHVNYGQTLGIWDRVFGTWRRAKKEYGADVFTEDQDRPPVSLWSSRAAAGREDELVDYRSPRA